MAASGITAVALLISNGLNYAWDWARLKRDSTERQKDRDHAVADHWRDQRLAAHAAFLAAVEALNKHGIKVSVIVQLGGSEVPPGLDQIREDVRQAWSQVEMLGSREAVKWGRIVEAICGTIEWQARTAPHMAGKDGTLESLDVALQQLDDPLAKYRREARKDIGTEAVRRD